MKIVKVQGGLGNQLFQYAFGELLKKKYRVEDVEYDISFFSQQNSRKEDFRDFRVSELGYDAQIASDEILKRTIILPNRFNPHSRAYKLAISAEKIINNKYYYEENRAPVNISEILNHSYFDGYWQCWKYVIDSEIGLPKFRGYSKEDIKKICTKYSIDSASAFIGIRRGDYTNSTFAREHFGSYSEEYFNKGIGILKERTHVSNFQIFSNDIEWVKKNIHFNTDNEKVVYHDQKDSDIDEFIMMTQCGNSIIVNSTFYWWASYFMKNADKVIIAPKRWFFDDKPIDIIPPQWIKLEE